LLKDKASEPASEPASQPAKRLRPWDVQAGVEKAERAEARAEALWAKALEAEAARPRRADAEFAEAERAEAWAEALWAKAAEIDQEVEAQRKASLERDQEEAGQAAGHSRPSRPQ
jgi:hypothetical protein